jgi:hypothetical protein
MNIQNPWSDPEAGLCKTLYPSSWGKKNCYVLFSPGIDRFFLVDSLDPWIMLETSRILSSKISNIVYILDQETPYFDNSDCLYFTTKHKMDEKFYGGPTVMSHRQSSFMIKIRPDIIIKTDWPIDFIKPERKNALLKLQEYSQFVLRTVHALTCAINLRNSFPEKYYVETYFKDSCPPDLTARPDTTDAPHGIENLIKNILYDSNSINEALENIHDAWRKYSWQDVLGIRQTFYTYSGIEQPQDLADLGNPGNFDKDRNPQTMWVV